MKMNEQFGDLIVEIYKKTKTLTEQKLKHLGIGMGQLHILMLYYGNPGGVYSQTEMVQLLEIDKGNISRNIHKLMDKNYLAPAEMDHKKYQLTEEGLVIKSQIMTTFVQMQSGMTHGVSRQDLETTMAVLKAISDNFKVME